MNYNAEEFAFSNSPKATVLPAGKAERDAYGHRYGRQTLFLTSQQLAALEQGSQIAVEIMDGEYILFLSGPCQE